MAEWPAETGSSSARRASAPISGPGQETDDAGLVASFVADPAAPWKDEG